MRLSLGIVVCSFLIIASCVCAQAQYLSQTVDNRPITPPNQESTLQRLAFEVGGGFFWHPGWIFALDGSVTRHSDKLTGFLIYIRADGKITKKIHVCLEISRSYASGTGQWARSDTAKELTDNGLDPDHYSISGVTTIHITSIVPQIAWYFDTKYINWYVMLGGGLGWYHLDFNGKFEGYEMESGYHLPISNPAEDHITRIIPVIQCEVGMRHEISRHISVTTSFGWKTGYAINVGIRYCF